MGDKYMTPDYLRALAAEAEEKAPIGSMWRHRNGGQYVVDGIAITEGTLAPAVIYRPLDGNQPPWVRPAAEFFDGRFARIGGSASLNKIKADIMAYKRGEKLGDELGDVAAKHLARGVPHGHVAEAFRQCAAVLDKRGKAKN